MVYWGDGFLKIDRKNERFMPHKIWWSAWNYKGNSWKTRNIHLNVKTHGQPIHQVVLFLWVGSVDECCGLNTFQRVYFHVCRNLVTKLYSLKHKSSINVYLQNEAYEISLAGLHCYKAVIMYLIFLAFYTIYFDTSNDLCTNYFSCMLKWASSTKYYIERHAKLI